MSYQGKTAVITGASRGIGAGLARVFHAEGLSLALCSRSTPALPESERVLSVRADVTDPGAIELLAERAGAQFGTIDLWINNAGVLAPIGMLRDLDGAAVKEHLETNVLGVFHGTRAYVRHLRESRRGGVLVNISSGAARRGFAGWSAYCASKAAVDLMTECVAIEEAERGLRAYSVAPGIIDTAMQELIRGQRAEDFPDVERFRQMKRDDAFSSEDHVARELLKLAFASPPAPDVRVDLPPERP
jgi:benzil reductase ((S)-benzoin forming)